MNLCAFKIRRGVAGAWIICSQPGKRTGDPKLPCACMDHWPKLVK
jgi:hypothetical protein